MNGAIKIITRQLKPRYARVVAMSSPTEREKSMWYFQRYVKHVPTAGDTVLFDRSCGQFLRTWACPRPDALPAFDSQRGEVG